MQQHFDRLLSITLFVCAIGVTGTVMHREFAPASNPALPPLDRPAYVASWQEAMTVGIQVGNAEAPVKIVEFTDLECPFCRMFHRDVSALMKKHPEEVSVTFVHFPLPNHRFALPAARAVECAASRGQFAELVTALFEKQDSIGLKPWGEFAREAGIPDTAAFGRCAVDPARIARIDDGRAYGAKIQVRSTPTVLINGWRYGRAPALDELEDIVARIRKGGSPGDTTASR